MLSYALAIAVALSSLVLFFTAFFRSDIHCQDDFLWSGVGLFYALVLWFCARNITGAVLLGQAAASILLISYNWQILKLRTAVVDLSEAPQINNFSVLQAISGLLKRNKSQPQPEVPPATDTTLSKVTEEVTIPETTSEESTSNESDQTQATDTDSNVDEVAVEKAIQRNVEPEDPQEESNANKAIDTDSKVDEVSVEVEEILEKTIEINTPISTSSTQVPPITDTQTAEVNSELTQVDSEALDSEVENIKPGDSIKDQSQEQLETKLPAVSEPAKVNPEEKIDSSFTLGANVEIQPKNPSTAIKQELEVPPQSSTAQSNLEETEDRSLIDSIPSPASTTVEINQDEQNESEQKTGIEPELEVPPQSSTAQSNLEETEDRSLIDSSPSPASTPVEINQDEQNESEQKTSSLDSLETVEVAEVLEAVPEDMSTQGESDESNIIEVTTTEINTTTDSQADKNHDSQAGDK